MMRINRICFIIVALIICHCIVIAVADDLSLSDRITILSITQHGEATRDVFDIRLDDVTYENMKELLLQRIRDGYKPDCDCDFDNDFFIQLSNRPPVVVYSGSYRDGANAMLDVWFRCRIVLSRNKRYAGLIFQQHINNALYHQHFMLVDSKGNIMWEMPHEMKETLADSSLRRINFPDNGKSRIDGHYHVSNSGKVLYVKSHMYDSEKYWELYHKDGKLIKKQSNWSAFAEFSPDGSYFLVQENNDPQSYSFDPESGTSCYDANTGELLWRKKNILPIQNAGYFFSPSGNKITAYLKTNVFSPCFIDKKGAILAISIISDETRCRTVNFSPGWNSSETLFSWPQNIYDSDFRFHNKRPSLPKEYDLCSITHTYALDEMYYLSFGTCCVDQECKRQAKETKKFICFSNDEMEILGLVFIETSGLSDQTIRIEIDHQSRLVYFRMNDEIILNNIEIFGEL